MATRWSLPIVATIIVLALACDSAYAQDPAASTEGSVDTVGVHPVTQQDDTGLDPESVAGEIRGYAAAHGISEDAARSLFFFQNEASDLIELAESMFPDTYAGAWLSNYGRGGELMLAFTRETEASALQVALNGSNQHGSAGSLLSTTWRLLRPPESAPKPPSPAEGPNSAGLV